MFRGEVCLVSEEDYEKVKKYRWFIDSNGYPASRIEGKITRMHRFIMEPKKGLVTDHINRLKFDNRRENLRYCTPQENGRNKTGKRNSISGYRGVSPNGNYWRAYISTNKKQIHLGTYRTKEEAAMVYDKKAREMFGKFSVTNFNSV